MSPRELIKEWRSMATKCRERASVFNQRSTLVFELNARATTFDACARQLEESLGEPLERMNEP